MSNPPAWDSLVKDALSDGRVVSASELEALGLSRVAIGRLVDRGILERERRGLYVLGGGTVVDPLALLSKRFGGSPDQPWGILCLQVAAHIHGLTDMGLWNIPKYELALPIATNPRISDSKSIRVIRLRRAHMVEHLEWHEFGGSGIHVTSPARTVCDLYSPWAGKIGEGAANEALARLVSDNPHAARQAVEMASKLGWGSDIARDLETMRQFKRYTENDEPASDLKGMAL